MGKFDEKYKSKLLNNWRVYWFIHVEGGIREAVIEYRQLGQFFDVASRVGLTEWLIAHSRCPRYNP